MILEQTKDRTLPNLVAQLIEQGKVVIVPSDTIYALICDCTNSTSVEDIYRLKSRPQSKALPIFCPDIDFVQQHFDLSALEMHLATTLWPGPVTMVINKKRSSSIASNVNLHNSKIAVRCPNHRFIQQIMRISKKPLVATSANISGVHPSDSSEITDSMFAKKLPVVRSTQQFDESKVSSIIEIIDGKITFHRRGLEAEKIDNINLNSLAVVK